MTNQTDKKTYKLPAMTLVTSQSIKAMGYQDGVLTAQFTNGGIYHYPGVAVAEFNAVMNAESTGKAFQVQIRAKFRGIKHED